MSIPSSAASIEQWLALDDTMRSIFYSISAKSESGHTAFEFFDSEIPDSLKSDPEGIRLLLDGGTIQVPIDTFERGRASTGTDTVEYELPDRDMSRVEAGHNGGDYTPDNVILEDASINRARGGVDMTDGEYQTAADSISTDADLISQRIVEDTSGAVDSVAAASDGILETVLEGVLPVTVGAKLAHTVWNSDEFRNAPLVEKTAVSAGIGGLGVATTVAVLANPIGATAVGLYGTYKLLCLGGKLWNKYA